MTTYSSPQSWGREVTAIRQPPGYLQADLALPHHVRRYAHAEEGRLRVDVAVEGDPPAGALHVEGGNWGVVAHLQVKWARMEALGVEGLLMLEGIAQGC